MAYVMQYIRSVIFIILMYVWMLILGVAGAIPALFSRRWAYNTCRFYCTSVFWLLRVLCGLTFEVRGKVPTGSVIIASKHQSFLDVMINFHNVERGSFIMKRELKWAPILGFYAMRVGATPVKRGAKSKSMKQMVSGVETRTDDATQLVIYPQGTRVPPGQYKPYKVGAAVLCQRFGRPCIPAATNVGVFWNKRGFYRKPGVAVLEYLDPLPEGLSVEEMTAEMERVIESNSNRLMAEAGFDVSNISQDQS